MEKALYELTVDGNRCYLLFWFSDNPASSPGCDSCIGYTAFDKNREELDGGEMDYDSGTAGYASLSDAADDVADFAFEGCKIRGLEPSDLDPDQFGD